MITTRLPIDPCLGDPNDVNQAIPSKKETSFLFMPRTPPPQLLIAVPGFPIQSHPYSTAATPTNPIIPAAANANGTFVAAAKPPDELDVGLAPPPVISPARPPLIVELAIVEVNDPFIYPNAEVIVPFTVAARLVVMTLLPLDVIVVSCVTFPVVVGLTVASLAWLLITLNWFSMAAKRLEYCGGRGTAVRKSGAMVAVRMEETRELMSPVTEADWAADWMAMAKPGMRDDGMFCAAICTAAEEKAGPDVRVEPLSFGCSCWRGRRSSKGEA